MFLVSFILRLLHLWAFKCESMRRLFAHVEEAGIVSGDEMDQIKKVGQAPMVTNDTKTKWQFQMILNTTSINFILNMLPYLLNCNLGLQVLATPRSYREHTGGRVFGKNLQLTQGHLDQTTAETWDRQSGHDLAWRPLCPSSGLKQCLRLSWLNVILAKSFNSSWCIKPW